jgi:hypothetical protein
MTELLDTIDSFLQEVEEQLLQEFERIRNTLSDSRYEPIDLGVRNALAEVTRDLYDRLDHSGDSQNMSLMTERHEVLLSRIVVIRRLLDAKVPTAFLHEAHTEVVTNRKQLEAKVNAKRQSAETPKTELAEEKRGFMGKLKGFFSDTGKTENEVSRNRIKITEQEIQELEPVSIYLDNGIYSASRELAALANVFSLPKDVQEKIQAEHKRKVEGKALFESRDLSAQKADAKPDRNLAQTPEDIRRKLAERQGSSVGKASFGSKDIEHVSAKEAAPKKPNSIDAAAARRAEIEAEKAKQPTSGKASFISKDIEPIQPQEFRKKADSPQSEKKPEPAKPSSGKAVFESRDLSAPGPNR